MTNTASLARRAEPLVTRAIRALEEIQAPVRDRLELVSGELRSLTVSDFAFVEEVNAYLLSTPGKLIRPTLTLLASEIGGEPSDDAVALAAAVELVHMATLVHDDAVDDSAMRRGMPTINSVWTHQVAIIMGDYLFSRSIGELARRGHLEAVRTLVSAINEMSVGEMRQLLSYDDVEYSESEYYRLISAKTASLASAACEMGALGGNAAYRDPLGRFGHDLGMAFQVVDDMLDYEGSGDVTGKPSGLDLRCRKVTLPLIGALRRMAKGDAERVRRFFAAGEADDRDEAEIREIVEMVRDNGGLEYARERAERYAGRASDALVGLPPGPALDSLRRSASYVVDRSW